MIMDSLWLKTTLRSKKITQRTLGDAIGLSQDKINKALAHVRQFTPIEAIKIADFLEPHEVNRAETLNAILGKDAVFLKVGEQKASGFQPPASSQTPKRIPIIGTVGSFGAVAYFDAGVKQEFAEPIGASPQPDSLVALRVEGGALIPAYQDGDLIYYDDHGKVDTKALGKEVVAELEDGKKFLRILSRSTMEGRFNLGAFHSPMMELVSLKSASRVLWTRKI